MDKPRIFPCCAVKIILYYYYTIIPNVSSLLLADVEKPHTHVGEIEDCRETKRTFRCEAHRTHKRRSIRHSNKEWKNEESVRNRIFTTCFYCQRETRAPSVHDEYGAHQIGR